MLANDGKEMKMNLQTPEPSEVVPHVSRTWLNRHIDVKVTAKRTDNIEGEKLSFRSILNYP